MPVSKARAAEIALRRSEMLTWKIMGRTPNQIAEHFGVSPGTARSDVSRAIKKARQLEVETAELYRFIQGSRLETLLRVLWPAATGMSGPLGQEGEIEVDLKAVEQVRKIITDINVLFGLNAPVRTEISGPDGGDIPFSGGEAAEVEALIAISDRDNAEIPPINPDAGLDDEDEDEEEDEDGLDDEDDDDDSA
ncbi:sigma-70 family RNA polymerase sigma factor [Streptomyces sp. WAC08241]|uniref:sigma-70 family RNA polymerase sigma factor n=1 Tax=Streptomyces sp. WAC08241 TaxID=2487421 RepID=UPI000F7AAE71|nr:sigma-70 family RNA polymerase sigma factor [Streptomyces sp. WAC08241]RSS38907.1 sigma-70 family RNA polymerase sigma factor [Streptomyces sp. WAC08241]